MNTPINKKRNAFICLVDRDIKKKKQGKVHGLFNTHMINSRWFSQKSYSKRKLFIQKKSPSAFG